MKKLRDPKTSEAVLEESQSKIINTDLLKQRTKEMIKRCPCRIISCKSQRKVAWDIFVMTLVVYNGMVVPIEYAFNP